MAQWIRVEAAALPRHRKTERLMSALGLTRIEATGALVLLWGRALEEAPDGCLADWSAADISRAMELAAKDPGVVVDALVESGFAERSGNHLILHEWMTYQGNFREAKRKAAWRALHPKDIPPESEVVPGPSRDIAGRGRDSRAGADVTDVTYGQTTPLASADAEPVLELTSPETNGKADDDWTFEQCFATFYEEYPRKVKRPTALRAWKAIKPQNQKVLDAIFAGMYRWADYWKADGTDPKNIPYPASFLNGRQWEDQPS